MQTNDPVIVLLDNQQVSRRCEFCLEYDYYSVSEPSEDWCYVAYLHEMLRKEIKIVHFDDFDALKEYNLNMPNSYPAVRIAHADGFTYLPDMAYTEFIFPGLALKVAIDEYSNDYTENKIAEWEQRCARIKQQARINYVSGIATFAMDHADETTEEDLYLGIELDLPNYIRRHKDHPQFPREPVPVLPICPKLNMPWEENYQFPKAPYMNRHRLKFD